MRTVSICVVMAFIALAQVSGYTIEVPVKEVVHVFKNGDALSYDSSGSYQPYNGPINLLVLSNGNLIVSDNISGKTKLFDKNFQVIASLQRTASYICTDGTYLFGAWNGQGQDQFLARIDGNKFTLLKEFQDSLEPGMWFFDRNYLYSPANPGTAFKIEKSKLVKITEDQWLENSEYLRERTGVVYERHVGYVTSSSGRLLTATGTIPGGTDVGPADDGTYDEWSPDAGEIFGIDAIGNKYFWSNNRRIVVAKRDGPLMKDFLMREGLDSAVWTSFPTITPNGDIYFFESDKSGHKLTRIKNTWDPITMATLNDGQVRVRDAGSTNGKTLATLNKGDKVAILETSKDKQTIGGKTDPWYRVQLSDWSTGWVFGAFVDIDVVR